MILYADDSIMICNDKNIPSLKLQVKKNLE